MLKSLWTRRGATAATSRPCSRRFGGESRDVVLSTVDTVGIPLMLLKRVGRVRRRSSTSRSACPSARRLQSERNRAASVRAPLAVGGRSSRTASTRPRSSARAWRRSRESTRVEFVPFGVDEHAFVPSSPAGSRRRLHGADPHRDVELFLRGRGDAGPIVSHRHDADRARRLGASPPNVEVEADIPFDAMPARLEEARVVAYRSREQLLGSDDCAAAGDGLGKPVVVTRTEAIATGYGLVDGENCRLVEPGDARGFGRAVAGGVLRDEWHARAARGARARAPSRQGLSTWDRYVNRIEPRLTNGR